MRECVTHHACDCILEERDRLRGEVKALEILQTCKSEDVLAAFGANNNLTRERDTLLAELDALRGELAVAKERYGPAGYKIIQEVTTLRKERDTLRECLNVAESLLEEIDKADSEWSFGASKALSMIEKLKGGV